jgi:16S rRNA (guanine527-N7)-methyltransferase
LSILAESLAGLEFEQVRTARRLADVGSGAGFPGLVLAIAIPHARVTLIEKRGEVCSFLRRASEELGLDNVNVVEQRAHLWSDGRGACDVATARNAGRVDKSLRLCAPLAAPGGVVVLWLKRRRDSDMETLAAEAAEETGLRLAQVHQWEYRDEARVDVKHLYLYEKGPDRS